MAALEQRIAQDVIKNEKRLDSIITRNDTILVVDLWASWCGPCIREYLLSVENREKLSDLGVKFIMVSVDDDIDSWRNIILRFGMEEETHIRIGPNSTYLEQLEMEKIPRFLVYKHQELINSDAPLPHTEVFMELVGQLMKE